MRKVRISSGEYYHLYNRGVGKINLFHDKRDWSRFLFYLLYFQALITFTNPSFFITNFTKKGIFELGKTAQKVVGDRKVELVAFCLMPNHFHLIAYEKEEGGIARYMQRVLNAYTKYFNAKYGTSGHLFQGPYQAVHVEDNRQLLHLSAYIHRNPREWTMWKNREEEYPWSSFRDYVEKNRWGELLAQAIIAEQFNSKEEYLDFVETSPAKDSPPPLMDTRCP